MATVSNVVCDHDQSGAGRDDANRPQASGRRLGLIEHGSGAIPLVLLHGWPQTSYAWRHVTPLLTSDCHALAYDLPGIGSSEPATDRFDKWSISGIFTPISTSAASSARWSWATAWGLKSRMPTCAATPRRSAV